MRDETTLTGLGNLTSGAELPVTKVGDHYFAITPPGASQPTTFALITGESGKVEYLHIGQSSTEKEVTSMAVKVTKKTSGLVPFEAATNT
ncbi:MAG: hypothetical protein IPL01_13575 [Acidobacteria bacterium]|nr:hypothetical protein [Acidobacteriota bacterium]